MFYKTLLLASVCCLATAASATEVKIYNEASPLAVGTYSWEGGETRDFTVGLGSGAFYDSANSLWVITDRGPNFDCGDVEDVTGLPEATFCAEKKVRVYPFPAFNPSIYKLTLGEDGTFAVAETITLKGQDGSAITGLPNALTVAKSENAVDGAGQPLAQDPSAVDSEALVRLADGSFIIAEENAPSLLKVAADGTIQERWVPAGSEGDFAAASYPTKGLLPAILTKRQSNRGLESLALSADGSTLFALMQNPLANPDKDTYDAAKNTRLLVIDLASGAVTAEYVYQLADPAAFTVKPPKNQSGPRISELLYLGKDRLLVLERTDQQTLLFEISLAGASNIMGTAWDDVATAPSLEASNDVAAVGLVPVTKTLKFDSANHPELPGKIEGMTFLDPDHLALINDNDFGNVGATTHVVVLTNSGITLDPM